VTSIERTAYPRFGRLVTARESDGLVPVAEEVEWARAASRSEEHLLSLVVALKCFQRLGYFPRAGHVPLAMIERVRGCLGLGDAAGWQPPDRTGRWQQQLVRERLGVVSDPERARSLAEHAIRSEAEVKNHPPDLINVALEVLVREGFELPAFSTLDEIATRARAEVNAGMFSGIVARMRQPEVLRLNNLLDVADGKSGIVGLKRAAGKASWSHFRAQVAHLRWVDSLGDARGWVEGIAESKIADFAGEAAAADAAVMRDVAQPKQTALIACLVHVAQTRARDELAEMFCKRMAAVTKRARGELDRLREEGRELSERLIDHYRELLERLDPARGDSKDPLVALALAREAVERAGGFASELSDVERVAAHHANNYMPLVYAQIGKDRSTMYEFTRVVELEATSADRSVLDALEHAVAHRQMTRDVIPDHHGGRPVDLSFASEQWQRLVRPHAHPGRLHRRHFEACVFTYLAAQLRTGDVAVKGSEAYANWAAKLLSWEECEPLLGEFCAESDLPETAEAFVEAVRSRLAAKAAEVDAGYPANTDLTIDRQTGRPTLKRRRGNDRTRSAIVLEERLKQRMPERTVLEMLARTAFWTGWHHQFGPASGSDPKLRDPLVRYAVTTFTYGSRMGAAQAARHMRGISPHELGATFIRHVTSEKLDRASAQVVNAYLKLDIAKVWGDASSVAADGTMVETLLDNLLAERHIRYGGYGGIAYHHVADNYIALFSHFIPCGVWEAVYIIEGLLKQQSEADPDTIHADTQGQSYPVHALSHLFGFELLTRIRNWKDRTFYRPDRERVYEHIDSLFGDPGENVIDWELIAMHWRDLMRIALSIRDGRLSSTLLLRRLSSESRRNNVYKAFRELGRAICTITLLRLISEPELRAEIDAATNKVESYNQFSDWLAFGAAQLDRNDPEQLEKLTKAGTLLANCVILHIALDMTDVVRDLQAAGHPVMPDDLATMSPYITERVKRFGEYPLDGLDTPPETFDPHLHLPANPGANVDPIDTAAA
jgi:TnpA family transposase